MLTSSEVAVQELIWVILRRLPERRDDEGRLFRYRDATIWSNPSLTRWAFRLPGYPGDQHGQLGGLANLDAALLLIDTWLDCRRLREAGLWVRKGSWMTKLADLNSQERQALYWLEGDGSGRVSWMRGWRALEQLEALALAVSYDDVTPLGKPIVRWAATAAGLALRAEIVEQGLYRT